jgi:hypothetical protein
MGQGIGMNRKSKSKIHAFIDFNNNFIIIK